MLVPLDHKRRFLVLLFATLCCMYATHACAASAVISEVLWSGSDLSTADEWVELRFVGNNSVHTSTNLSGWRLTVQSSSGAENDIHVFGSGARIHSGQYLLISNFATQDSRLLVEPDVVTSTVSLPNTKLLLRLYNGSGELVDTVDDGVGAPFAGRNASGTGVRISMERISMVKSGTDIDNWADATASIGFDVDAPIRGTPGFPNSVKAESVSPDKEEIPPEDDEPEALPSEVYTDIYITEVLANPVGSDTQEWVEIGNWGSGAVNIAGLTLRTASGAAQFSIPSRTSSGFLLLPQEHVLFTKEQTGLQLRNAGDAVELLHGESLLDVLQYPEAVEGVSFGREPGKQQAGIEAHQHYCIPTPAMINVVHAPELAIGIQSTSGEFSQSGQIVGTGKVTLNLQAEANSGTLIKAECSWQYSDGFSSDSCNPPSHTFRTAGEGNIKLNVKDYCGNTVKQTLNVLVLNETNSEEEDLKKSSQNAGESVNKNCIQKVYSDVQISEAFPDPFFDEKDGEWIEIQSLHAEEISLCGWAIDDSEKGSTLYTLDDKSIGPYGYLLLERKDTGIAINNSGDRVRLFAPDPEDENQILIDDIEIPKSIEGESYARREDGHFVWTPDVTPGSANIVRAPVRVSDAETIVVSAALPNPVGSDVKLEWIEISNLSHNEVGLEGWSLGAASAGHKKYRLGGTLSSGSTQRLGIEQTGIELQNDSDSVILYDPSEAAVSAFGWHDAVAGRIYRRPVLHSERIQARVEHVVDGDTVDVALINPDQLHLLPPSVKRRWLGITSRGENSATLRVRMIGIDTPETVHPTKSIEAFGSEASSYIQGLLLGAEIELQFDQEIWDKYDRLLAYVYLEGALVQAEILRLGLAASYTRFPFAKQDEFVVIEQQARQERLGMWALSLPEVEDEYLQTHDPDAAVEDSFEANIVIGATISEIYPHPRTDEAEWIELWNPTDQDIDLSGWILDDVRESGSAPWVISEGTVIPAQQHLVLSDQEFSIALNNSGDEVWLLSPDEQVGVGVAYGKTTVGHSLSVLQHPELNRGFTVIPAEHICESSTPTAWHNNECIFQSSGLAKGLKSNQQLPEYTPRPVGNSRIIQRFQQTPERYRHSAAWLKVSAAPPAPLSPLFQKIIPLVRASGTGSVFEKPLDRGEILQKNDRIFFLLFALGVLLIVFSVLRK